MHLSGTALITGASSGIGRSIAFEFARNGHSLILVARRQHLLEKLQQELVEQYDVNVEIMAVDLAQPNSPKALFDTVSENGRSVDFLVNNAGLEIIGRFVETDMEKIESLINVNALATTRLTRLFVPPMIERGGGGILNVASLGACYPCPGFATYGASKAYVLSLTEALSEELRPHDIRVTALCPGPVRTPMYERAMSRTGGDNGSFVNWLSYSPDELAREAYQSLTKGTVVHFNGIATKALALFGRYQPRSWVRAVMGLSLRRL